MSDDSEIRPENTKLVATVTILLELIMKYGIPFVLEVLESLKEGEITKEDIDNLKINKEPDEYFPNYDE